MSIVIAFARVAVIRASVPRVTGRLVAGGRTKPGRRLSFRCSSRRHANLAADARRGLTSRRSSGDDPSCRFASKNSRSPGSTLAWPNYGSREPPTIREIASRVPRTAILPCWIWQLFGRRCYAATSRFTRNAMFYAGTFRVRACSAYDVQIASEMPWKVRVSRSVNQCECAIAISRSFPIHVEASVCAITKLCIGLQWGRDVLVGYGRWVNLLITRLIIRLFAIIICDGTRTVTGQFTMYSTTVLLQKLHFF